MPSSLSKSEVQGMIDVAINNLERTQSALLHGMEAQKALIDRNKEDFDGLRDALHNDMNQRFDAVNVELGNVNGKLDTLIEVAEAVNRLETDAEVSRRVEEALKSKPKESGQAWSKTLEFFERNKTWIGWLSILIVVGATSVCGGNLSEVGQLFGVFKEGVSP